MKLITSIILLFSLSNVFGQGAYAPPAGTVGTTAIYKDSSIFKGWGTNCEIIRGYMQIDNKSLGFASVGDSSNANGAANGTIVSLGDSGVAIFDLDQPIYNGTGPDFAVFENGFNATFLELAFVEVSSDGVNYFRFPAYSDTQDTTQVGSYGSLDATNLHNLAGKYQVNYGTPFDLEDIPSNALLNKSSITHIKIVDVIGNISSAYTTYDSQSRKVNDPWPTAFASSGFDLDAVGLINIASPASLEENVLFVSIYPNPFTDKLTIDLDEEIEQIQLFSVSGKVINISKSKVLNLAHLKEGVYFLKIKTNTNFYVQKVVKK